ncbi:MAG: Smr/MutS family protein [Gemmatimonadota bacterium]
MAKRKKKRRASKPPDFGFFGDLLDATPVATLDLHGDTALEAERRVRDFVATHARISTGKVIHIITGRGGRSGRPPVLPGAVVRALKSPQIARLVQEYDWDLDEAGFLVRLR